MAVYDHHDLVKILIFTKKFLVHLQDRFICVSHPRAIPQSIYSAEQQCFWRASSKAPATRISCVIYLCACVCVCFPACPDIPTFTPNTHLGGDPEAESPCGFSSIPRLLAIMVMSTPGLASASHNKFFSSFVICSLGYVLSARGDVDEDGPRGSEAPASD